MENKNKYPNFPESGSQEMQAMMLCMSISASCSKKCLEEGHKNTAILCAECADICALAARWHSCQSEFSSQMMNLCAEVCYKCGIECQKMEEKHCQECAQVCLMCAEVCSEEQSIR